MPSVTKGQFIPFLRTIREFSDRRLVLSAGAIVILGVVEGASLLLVLPLLQAIGIANGSSAGTFGQLAAALHDLGLPRSLPGLLAVLMALALLQVCVKTTLARLNSSIGSGFVYFLRKRLHNALVNADWSVFLRQRSSDIVRALTVETATAGSGASQVVGLASAFLQTSVQVWIAWLVSPTVTVVSLLVGIVVVFLIRPFSVRARGESRANQADRGALAANLSDHINGLKLAKSHGMEARCAQIFDQLSRTISQRQINIAVDQSRANAGFGLGSAIGLCGFLWYAVQVQSVQGAEIAVLGVIFMRLASRLMSIQGGFQRMTLILPSFELTETLRHAWLAAATPSTSSPLPPRLNLNRQVEFSNVNFHYPDSDVKVLSEINLCLPAGKITAICGPSGAGKSTLADLCLGLIRPSGTCITIDGKALDQDHLPAWRTSVAYVPQDVFLFNETLRHNLIFLNEDVSDAQIEQALAAAAAKDLVTALPDGLETIVGDRGIRLSGGERQRIALARALLRKPTLLVLDEATSSIDPQNERIIQQAVENLRSQLTVLMIAHRLSTIRHADQIVVLDQGRIVQRGTWNQLAKEENGVFAQMAETARI